MKLFELGSIIAAVAFGLALLFAPNPDVDGDGNGEQLRITTQGITLEDVAPVTTQGE